MRIKQNNDFNGFYTCNFCEIFKKKKINKNCMTRNYIQII